MLTRRNAYVGLPEIIEQEVRKHIVKAGGAAADQITGGFRIVEILLGSRPDYRLPSPAEFQKAVESRLEEMNKFLVRIPFTLQHAKAALEMANNELPPNGPKNQQFKDSAIWQALLDLSLKYDVVFITSDKGFFKGREPRNGLAENLIADCRRVGGQIDVYYDFSACLEALQKDVPPLDEPGILTTIHDHLYAQLSQDVARRGFALGELLLSKFEPFATEKINVLALTFNLTYAITDISQSGEQLRAYANVQVAGDCSYRTESKDIEDMRLGSEAFEWTDHEGKPVRSVNVFASGMCIIGTRIIPYKLRQPVT